MAEVNIANNAGVVVPDIKTYGSWICRDDNGHYWTIFQNTDGDIAIYHSEDSGGTWTLKKTLTTSDFTSLTMPVDAYCIANLTGQNKVYVLLAKRAYPSKSWGWVIDTSADTGAVDLDNDTMYNGGYSYAAGKIQLKWDNFNTKLWVWNAFTVLGLGYVGFWQQVVLDGTLSASTDVSANNKGLGCDIDSSGNKFTLGYAASASGYATIYKGTGATNKATTYDNYIFLFGDVVCDYNNKVVFGFVIGTVFHTYRADNGLTTFEIDDSQVDLGAGHTPTIAFLAVDGNNNIYWVYTDSNDDEAYYMRYSGGAWGSATKISSNNDGIIVGPELRAPLSSIILLTTYQATA